MTSRRTKISPKSGRGLGHVTPTIFGSTVGYPSDSLASCSVIDVLYVPLQYFDTVGWVFCPVKSVSHITHTVLAGT